jgi:peptidoglycan/LPS O-acetylase OafA/YrhL
MNNPARKTRLDVLDGLRGFAMILVFLNHVDSGPIVQAFPPSLQTFVLWFFLSGKIGISFFFILSGFLMGYLYKNPAPVPFIQKRYARIFPPFLTMVAAMTVFRHIPELSLLMRIAVIVGFAFVTRVVWVYIIERYNWGTRLISLFLVIQALVFVWYGFFIMRHPPVWFSHLPFFIREATITAVNATLTLPLGDYLPMIDGVYWSLIPEILFYLIYPFLFTPFLQSLSTKKLWVRILSFAALFPFFFGMSLLFKHVRGFGMMFIEYFLYFCVGITTAHIASSRKPDVHPRLKSFINPLFFCILLFLAYIPHPYYSPNVNLALKLLWSVPFGMVVYCLIDETTALSSFFSNRFLTWLGTISFSLYIVHTSIVDGMHLIFRPTTLVLNIIFIAITFCVAVGVAYLIHVIVEKLYFYYKGAQTTNHVLVNKRHAVVVLTLVLAFLFFSAYATQYNFFSSEYAIGRQIVQTKTKQKSDSIQLTSAPTVLRFEAPDDNLGILSFHITHESIPNIKTPPSLLKQFVVVKMKETNQPNWYATQKTSSTEIGQSKSYPFGFPLIADSKSKTYEVQLSLENVDPSTRVLLHTDEYALKSVHQADKRFLATHPLAAINHLSTKIVHLVQDPESQIVLLSLIPLLMIYIYIGFGR